jgi:Rps23 Pro-64 3,4-dihydroxylase Tpa1-like proline 4-hydroxylase
MLQLDQRRAAYQRQGFAVIDGVAEPDEARALLDLFDGADCDSVEQHRANHYSHVFKGDLPQYPGSGEAFRARFKRFAGVERAPLLSEVVDRRFRPALAQTAATSAEGDFKLHAYRLDAGDHIRAHSDDYSARLGFVYYLCPDWKIDWGGLLHFVKDGEILTSLPAFNRLVVVNHQLRLTHFVGAVAEYALHPRHMIVGFLT